MLVEPTKRISSSDKFLYIFLKNYTIPFVQLNPMKSILCFAHDANTFDKSRLLQNPNPDYDDFFSVYNFEILPGGL